MKPLGSSLWHCQPSLSCWPEQFLAVVSLVYSYHKLHQVPFLPHHAARNIPWVCATVYKKFNCFLCFTAYWYCYSRECFGDGSIIIFTPRSFLRLQAISRQNVNTSVRSPGDYRKLFPHGLHSSKNNLFEIKISQRPDWECPSLSYYGSCFYIFFLNPVYVTARSLRSLRNIN